jgi:hypothetical protein
LGGSATRFRALIDWLGGNVLLISTAARLSAALLLFCAGRASTRRT